MTKEHCTIEIPSQDENTPPQNRASSINGLWKMTSKLGRKRPSQEPVSPTSEPGAKRLCETSANRSVFGRLGQALWTAGGSVAHAVAHPVGALGSLATFRARRGSSSEPEADPEESNFAPEAEASDAVVVDVAVMLEQKDAAGLRFDEELRTELEEEEPVEGRTDSKLPQAWEELTLSEAQVHAATVPVPVSPPGAHCVAPPEAGGVDVEIEYQQLLDEIAQEPMIEPSTDAADEVSHYTEVTQEPCNQGSIWEAPTATGIDWEAAHIHAMNQAHIQAMNQVVGQSSESMDWAQASNDEDDHACIVSIDTAPGHPHCESGQYCRGTPVDDLFEDGGDAGHYYCGACFESAGVV